ERSYPIGVTTTPTKVHPQVVAVGPTQVRKRSRERGEASLPLGIVFGGPHEHADAPHAVGLLRARRERPRRSATERSDELPPSHHWITSSAVASRVSGMVRPRALAVLRLINSSTFVDRRTGRSPGLSPFRMRPTTLPAIRHASAKSGP